MFLFILCFCCFDCRFRVFVFRACESLNFYPFFVVLIVDAGFVFVGFCENLNFYSLFVFLLF